MTRGKTVLANLACDKMNMHYGAVVAGWDGRDRTGKIVSAGKVTWSVHARNHDGVARAGGGAKQAISGVIKVGH